MPLSIGDAILRFVGDTSDLDQAFARIPAQTEAAMGAAAASVGGLGGAVQGVNFELDATAENVPYAGEVIKEAMGTARESTREAKGEAALLGEMLGIHLPRHVRNWVAELPVVSGALSAAFSATAVLFLIEALAKGIEKIQAWSEHAEKVRVAWDGFNTAVLNSFGGLDDKLLETGIQLDNLRGNHLGALRKELELIDHQTMRDLVSEFAILAKASDAMFATLKASWLDFDAGSKGAQHALTDFKTQYDLLLAEGKGKEASDLLAGTLKSAQDTLRTMKEQNAAIDRSNAAMEQSNVNAGTLAAHFQRGAAHGSDELKAQEALIAALGAQVSVEKKINELKSERKEGKELTEIKREEKDAEALAKKQELLFFEIAKAHAALQKQLEKQSEDTSKIETIRLNQELKDRTEKNKDDLDSLRQTIQAKLALIDGEMQSSQQKYEQQTLLVKGQYAKGLISAQQYLLSLKALNVREVQDLKQILDEKEKLVILEAQNEAARRGKILSEADAKELKGYIDLENKKGQLQADYENKFLKEEDRVTAKLAKNQATLGKLLDDYSKKLRAAETNLKGFANVATTVLSDISGAFGSAIQQWIAGQKSFGAAFAEAVKSYLAGLAAKAAADAIYFTGMGLAELATGFSSASAAEWFAAAAEMGAIAGAAGGLAAAIPSGGGGKTGSSGAGSSSSASGQDSSTKAGGQQNSTANVPRLFSGAIVTQPTLAMIGDSASGGRQTEGVFPLDDPRAAQAISRLFGGEGAGSGITQNFFIKGMLSTQDLAKTARIITRGAQTGRLRVSVANSARVTKRG